MQGREPVVVQLDPKWCVYLMSPTTAEQGLNPAYSLHSALKEFFEPLRTDNPRADFFAVYRKESDVFDREYAKKYDEDLNTSLIFVSSLTMRAGRKISQRTLISPAFRLACFPQSARRLSSMSNPSWNLTRTT